MQEDNVYFINMKKDIGRYIHIKPIVDKLNGNIWEGEDPTIIDTNGYAASFADVSVGTNAAKEAKLKLFNHFLKTSKSEYLFLFEDDIIIHKDFFNNLEKINNFMKETKPKLFYFGVSGNIKNIAEDNNIIIKKLFDNNTKEPVSGAYSVCINRNIINHIILRIKNPILKNKPFDMTCLGQIQTAYPNDCYICHPPMVIPYLKKSNIRDNRNQYEFNKMININYADYIKPREYPIFVKINEPTNIQYFDKLINSIEPYFKTYYLVNESNYSIIIKTDKIYDIIMIDNDFDYDKFIYLLKNNSFMNKNKVCIFLEDRFNFKYNESSMFFSYIYKLINNTNLLEDDNSNTNNNENINYDNSNIIIKYLS